MAALEPAWLTFGAGRCDLACHRDTWYAGSTATAPVGAGTSATHAAEAGTAPGQWVCGFGQDRVLGAADDTLLVGRISRRAAGRPAAAVPDASGHTLASGVGSAATETVADLFNYGCHPTSLGPGNVAISPDFIGAAHEVLERQFGGTAVFLQGACGDTAPMILYSAEPAAADRNGRMLGYAAAAVVESLLPAGTGLENSRVQSFLGQRLLAGRSLPWAAADTLCYDHRCCRSICRCNRR